MNGAQLAGLAIIGILLFGTVGAANVVTSADRTVLNGDYVEQKIEDEGAYDSIRNATIEEVLGRMENADLGEGARLLQAGNGTDNRTLVEDAVTDQYIRDETSENVQELYSYLNGGRSELYMDVDLRPLKNNLAASYGEQIEQKKTGTLVNEFGPEDSESPVPIEGDRVDRMKASNESYHEERLNFRVDVAWEATSKDQKLLLIDENPQEYSESEKDDIIQQREDEIRGELRQNLRDSPDELTIDGETIDVASEVDDRRQQAKTETCDRTREELDSNASSNEVCTGYSGGTSGASPEDNVTSAAVQFQYVIIDGLSEDGYDYESFASDLDDAEQGLSDETSNLAETRIQEEVPNTLSAQEQFGKGTLNSLRDARTGTSTVSLLVLVLPILALVLIGIAYLATRSVETTAKMTGIVFALAGGLSLVAATAARGTVVERIESAASESGASEFGGVVVTLAEGLLSALTTQSAALLVVGVVLIVLVAASRRGHLDSLKTSAGVGGTEPSGAEARTGGQNPPPGQTGPSTVDQPSSEDPSESGEASDAGDASGGNQQPDHRDQ